MASHNQPGPQPSNGSVAWVSQNHGFTAVPAISTAQPVVVVQQRTTVTGPSSTYGCNFSQTSSLVFGLSQLLLCALSIAGAVALTLGEAYWHDLGVGYWCGAIYLISGCIATVASGCPTKGMIIAVTVLSSLAIPFGITALAIGIYGAVSSSDCDDDSCITDDPFSMAGHSLIAATGFYQIVFGLCLLIISARAIHKASRAQTVTVAPVYYSVAMADSVQINGATHNQHL